MSSLFSPTEIPFWQVTVAFAAVLAYRAHQSWIAYRKEISLPKDAIPVEPLPLDLMNMALLQSEDWAREQTMDAMREDFHRLGSWDAVRLKYSKFSAG